MAAARAAPSFGFAAGSAPPCLALARMSFPSLPYSLAFFMSCAPFRVAIFALRRPQTMAEEWKKERAVDEEADGVAREVGGGSEKSSAIPPAFLLNNFAAALRIDDAEVCTQA